MLEFDSLCSQVQKIAIQTGVFLKSERERFDVSRVEEKSALGSAAAELCYVACGRFEARIEAFLGPWDVAAGGVIIMQAGGKLSDFSGGNKWISGEEVIGSNGLVHETVLSIMTSNNE